MGVFTTVGTGMNGFHPHKSDELALLPSLESDPGAWELDAPRLFFYDERLDTAILGRLELSLTCSGW